MDLTIPRLLGMQFVVGAVLAATLWGVYGTTAGYSALLGSLACVVPNTFLGLRLMAPRSDAKALLRQHELAGDRQRETEPLPVGLARGRLERAQALLPQLASGPRAEMQRELDQKVTALEETKEALESANSSLRAIAYIDAVTELPTRRLFDDRLDVDQLWHRRRRNLWTVGTERRRQDHQHLDDRRDPRVRFWAGQGRGN